MLFLVIIRSFLFWSALPDCCKAQTFSYFNIIPLNAACRKHYLSDTIIFPQLPFYCSRFDQTAADFPVLRPVIRQTTATTHREYKKNWREHREHTPFPRQLFAAFFYFLLDSLINPGINLYAPCLPITH